LPQQIVAAGTRRGGICCPWQALATSQIARNQLLTSVGVRAKINCGDRAAGYSLFYGVWEFLYEKVVSGTSERKAISGQQSAVSQAARPGFLLDR
jgi:hypothetical protein